MRALLVSLLTRLIFLDETAVHPHMCVRYGRSRRGQRVVFYRKRRGQRYTLIAAMGINGPVAKHLVKAGMKREDWARFLARELLPVLPQGSVLVMDNLKLHKEEWASHLIKAYGCAVLYLPPYSPETNPIELMFNVLKAKLRKAAPDGLEVLRATLEKAWSTVTPEFASSFFAHCGLCLPLPCEDGGACQPSLTP